MEKEKLVHYVPVDMVDQLKKLLVRLWETRNPASASLGAILKSFEMDVRSLNEVMLEISLKERSAALRENEKALAAEKENLRVESERILEGLRASAAAQVEAIKAAAAGEKAELAEELKKTRYEEKELAAENRQLREVLAEKEAEFERRLLEAKSEYAGESARRIQEAVEEERGRSLAALTSEKKKSSEAAAEGARTREENDNFKTALAAQARRFEERCGLQAEELAAKDLSLASARSKVQELEKQLSGLNEAQHAELAEKLRAKAAELNKAADERLEFERADWDARAKRQEVLLAKAAEDLKKAQNEIEALTAETRRLGGSVAEKSEDLERRLFEAKSEYARESGRRVREAVEAESGRLLEALKLAEKKSSEAEAETARIREENDGLKAALTVQAHQSGERGAWQAEELAAKDKYLAAAREKVKELEKQIVVLNDEHHSELMEKLRGKESEFRARLDEFEKERAAYLKAIAELKARFENERGGWEVERERIKAESGERYAALEAGLRASLKARSEELENDYAARREALAGELRGKDAELNREAAERLEFERATWEAQNRRLESLLARSGEDFTRAQKEIADLTAENRRMNAIFAEKEREFLSKNEPQVAEAVARERERLMSDFARQRAVLETAQKDRLAVFEEKEKNWSAEKERYESELALVAVSTRSFIVERAQKMKSDFAKWKEALEEEYKERMTAGSAALTFERDRLADEVKRLEPEYAGLVKKTAELETELFRLRRESHEGPGKPPQNGKELQEGRAENDPERREAGKKRKGGPAKG
jgi:hypothetical protein